MLTLSSKRASSYDSEPWQALLNQINEELRAHLDWIGVPWVENRSSERQVRMLDYACGPGVASRVRETLRRYVGAR